MSTKNNRVKNSIPQARGVDLMVKTISHGARCHLLTYSKIKLAWLKDSYGEENLFCTYLCFDPNVHNVDCLFDQSNLAQNFFLVKFGLSNWSQNFENVKYIHELSMLYLKGP